MQEKEEKTPLLKEDESENFFAFFSREFVRTFVSEPKPLFLLLDRRTDFLSCVLCVCVCINIKEQEQRKQRERERVGEIRTNTFI